jgi:eukaryotic-like serine/threonine-protein kinase
VNQAISIRYSPGTLLGGRYEVIRLLSRGGMAEVYLATDRQLGRRVAIKVILEQLAEDERFVARFRREARAAASLSHPNVVSVHDVGSHHGVPFLVMENVPGRTLAEILREQGPLPPDRVAEIGAAAALALAAAHRAGIVHRDVKPGNIMLTDSGQVKVLDFGIARALQWTPITDTYSVHGTAEYMSPEQVRGEGVDRRSDLYSLGAVLYELLAGRPLFAGESSLAVAYKHIEETPPPPDAPGDLTAIVMRCLAKHPADRHRDAGQLAADLARFRAGQPAATAPVPAPAPTRILREAWNEPPTRHHRRRGLAGWLVAAALAVVLASMAIGFVLLRDEPAEGKRQGQAQGQRRVRPPTALTAAGECDGLFRTEVVLTWEPSRTRATDGYEVFRATESGGPYERIVLLDAAVDSYVDEDVGQGNTYFYVVKATAGARASAQSSQAQAETPLGCLF